MSDDVFDDRLAVRRAVFGDAYVDAALSSVDAFSRPLQELVTRYAWGGVWERDGLSLKTRSLLNLAMLTVLNRAHELEIHLRGALNNGRDAIEIREVLLRAGIYAGMPAAVDAFRVARRVLEDAGVDLNALDD